MSNQEEDLIRCFASVFPGLSVDEIRNASAESIGVWDSLSSITLAAVIQQEFGLEIDLDILPNLDSFRAFHDHLFPLGSARQ